jgi:hypothetical protein
VGVDGQTIQNCAVGCNMKVKHRDTYDVCVWRGGCNHDGEPSHYREKWISMRQTTWMFFLAQ